MAMRLSLPASYSWQPQTLPVLANTALTRDIIEAVLFINGNMISIPNRIWGQPAPFTPTSTPGVAYGKFGSNAAYNGSSSYHLRTSAPYPLNTAGSWLKECSMMVVGKANATGATALAFSYGSTASSNPLFMAGHGATSTRFGIRVRDTAGVDVDQFESANGDWAALVYGVYIGTRSESRNKYNVYANGKPTQDTTAGSATGSVSFDRTATGCLFRSSAALFLNSNIGLAVSWARYLSPSDAAMLSANPWQIFDFPSRPLFLNSAAVGAFMPRQGLNIPQAVNRASTY